MNNFTDSILEIANACQNYNIGKIFISAILPSKRTRVNLSQINNTLNIYIPEIISYLSSIKI